MTVLGYILLVFALLWFAFKVYVSFDTEGGAIGMTPVLDGAVFPPTAAAFGVRLAFYPTVVGGRWQPLSGSDWLLLGFLWLGSVVLAGLLIVWVGKVGRKVHRN